MKLTASQLEAVTTTARRCLIVAGAGSGKTATLVGRVHHLIAERGESPDSILCITFTRKAAAEVKHRLAALLGGEEAIRDMMIGTFHAISLRILQVYGDSLGYDGPKITVLSPDDADMLLKQVATELGFFRSGKWRNGLSEKKVQRWREDLYCGRESEFDDLSEGQRRTSILDEYQARLFTWNLVDYGQLLLQTRRLLRDYPDVRQRYVARIKHVLVDEVQDTDTIQFDLHDIFSPPATLFAVGDTRQSIYGFRGARPDLAETRYSDAQKVNLAECFRCGDRILAAANKVIAHNGGSQASPLVGATGRGGTVVVKVGRSEAIAGTVADEGRNGYAWNEIAILARKHATLTRLEFVLREKGVPCYRVGRRFDICETDVFRDSLAAMRLILNHRDDLSLIRLCANYGIESERLTSWRVAANKDNVPPIWRAVFAEDDHALWRTLPPSFLSGPNCLVRDFVSAVDGSIVSPEVWQFWMDNCGDKTVAEAAAWFGLFNRKRDFQEDVDAAGNRVTLCTVHAAKGLEWPCVVVVGLNEGDFPSSQALREDGGVEEERRLMYVAMTRARERLVLHFRRPEDQSENGKISEPSRFLREAGVME